MKNSSDLPFGKKLRFLGEAVPFFAFMGLFRLIGLDAASALGGFIGRHVFRYLAAANVARQNLAAAYPEKTPDEIAAIVLQICENLGRVVAEYPHLDKLTIGPGQRIEYEGREHGDAAVARGKGAMFISGHLANWETMAAVGEVLNYKGGFVYRPPNNPYVSAWVSKQRGKITSVEQITKGAQGTRQFFNLLRHGKCVYIMVDQKTYEGVAVPFFGRNALTTPAPASLSLKLGAPLVPVSCQRTKGAHFKVKVYPPVEIEPSGDHKADTKALTAKMTACIEEIVRQDPAQWLWIHRRWTTPRDIEKMKALGIEADQG